MSIFIKASAAALALILSACAYTPPGSPVVGSEVGGTGNVSVRHERLGAEKHLITVSAAPGLGEAEGSIGQRILVEGNRFAAKMCVRGFQFDNDPNNQQQLGAGFMVRSRVFVFRCL
jgi:hypothetical protein